MNNIVAPGDNDALCGRGGHTIHWSGNIKFRALVEQHRDRYHAASRVEKSKVVAEVVQMWRQMTPPGRFLTLTEPNLGDASPWHDIGDKNAQKKTAKRLREGNGNATVVSDEDSSTSSSSKRLLRRVSNDSMEKAAKRVRKEFEFSVVNTEPLPLMTLGLFDDRISPVECKDDLPEPSWASIKAKDIFEQELNLEDLDSLFDDDQQEAVPEPVFAPSSTSWYDSSSIASVTHGGSALLQEIAVSIPSAADLTESIFFD
jgi:hypothetical protein